ncbi:hypothetical protein HMPREF1860_01520, partial [Prevotella amnii]
ENFEKKLFLKSIRGLHIIYIAIIKRISYTFLITFLLLAFF